MTPLFPENGQPIIIKQGKVNDCYLLSSLDCILNGGTDGRELVQSKFKQIQSGVYLRIKRTAQSANLDSQKMAGKYKYSYDSQTDEDIIFIDNQKLKEIDQDTNGAQSNSLAIKILERISVYYYAGQWEGASILAHNIQERHRETSTIFVSKLLGIQATDSRSFDDIIKLKTINPNEHIYISMNFGVKDQFGNYHGRHALRIEQIIPLVNGDFELELVNPWDNQKRERYYFSDLKERNCRFSVFDTDQQKKELTPLLLQCPVQLRDSKIYLKNIIDNLPQYVYWKDKNLVYQGCNNLVAQYLGLNSPLEIVGKTDNDFNWNKTRINFLHKVDKRT